jgi:hypothetical protein
VTQVYLKLAYVYGVASVAGWFYLFDKWVGLWAAILFCLPVGIGFAFLAPMLVATPRQFISGHDALWSWLAIAVGIAICVYALISTTGTTLVLLLLAGAGVGVGGAGVLQIQQKTRYEA